MYVLLLINFVFLLLFMLFTNLEADLEFIACMAFALHVLSGLYVYFKHGGERFTLLGIFSFMSVFFLALPYLYLTSGIGVSSARVNEATIAAAYSFAAIALVYSLRERKKSTVTLIDAGIQYSHLIKENSGRIILTILSTVAVGILIPKNSGMLRQIAEAFIFCGVVFSSLMLIGAMKWRRVPVILVAATLLVGAIAVYIFVIFSGFGRIRLVSLALVLAVLASTAYRIKWVKIAPLALAPILLVWAGALRSNMEMSASVLQSGSGLGSLLAPLDSLGRLISIERGGGLDLLFGESFLYIAYYWIPRFIWPDKPDGLGKVYVDLFDASLLEKGHSFSGSYLGEIFLNFGEIGLFVVPLLFGFLMYSGVRWFSRKFQSKRVTVRRYIQLALVYSILVSTIPDFVWADTNTLVQRAGTRIVVFYIIFYLVSLRHAKQRVTG